jgi:hypothetical protein
MLLDAECVVLPWGNKDGKADKEYKAKFIIRELVNTMKYTVVEMTWPDIQNQWRHGMATIYYKSGGVENLRQLRN